MIIVKLEMIIVKLITKKPTSPIVNESSKIECLRILGFYECYWWQKSACFAMESKMQQKTNNNGNNLHITLFGVEGSEWQAYVNMLKKISSP